MDKSLIIIALEMLKEQAASDMEHHKEQFEWNKQRINRIVEQIINIDEL